MYQYQQELCIIHNECVRKGMIMYHYHYVSVSLSARIAFLCVSMCHFCLQVESSGRISRFSFVCSFAVVFLMLKSCWSTAWRLLHKQSYRKLAHYFIHCNASNVATERHFYLVCAGD